jgi:hypothetical protein
MRKLREDVAVIVYSVTDMDHSVFLLRRFFNA